MKRINNQLNEINAEPTIHSFVQHKIVEGHCVFLNLYVIQSYVYLQSFLHLACPNYQFNDFAVKIVYQKVLITSTLLFVHMFPMITIFDSHAKFQFWPQYQGLLIIDTWKCKPGFLFFTLNATIPFALLLE